MYMKLVGATPSSTKSLVLQMENPLIVKNVPGPNFYKSYELYQVPHDRAHAILS